MAKLSVIIPGRNETFMSQTIENVLENIRDDTEIISVFDGYWPDPPVKDNEKVTILHYSEAVGQRAAINRAVRLSNSKYIMKLDAHCAVEEGFDTTLMAECDYDWMVTPRLFNLHAFDWQCEKCGHRVYQGKKPDTCIKCEYGGEFTQIVVWKPRPKHRSDFYRFDNDLHFQYWRAYESRPEARNDVADNMSLLGACFFMHRKRFWDIGWLDEEHGQWGQMGTELACKSWLSGGRLVVNKKTWFSHMFRTQNGFSFPYPNPSTEKARQRSRYLWLGNNWPKAVHKLEWLIDKFSPVPTWS